MNNNYRTDFPFFTNNDLIYFDNAATTQLPKIVIDKTKEYFENQNANASRSNYNLAINSTNLIENCREEVSDFINSETPEDIVFCNNTSQAINIVALGFVENLLITTKRKKIIISNYEHNSNYLIWDYLCKKYNIVLEFIENDNINIIDEDVIFVAITAASNILDIEIDYKKIIERSHLFNIPVLIDGAQIVAHQEIDVQKMDCDFFVFSGHKIYSSMGCGILYTKNKFKYSFEPIFIGGGTVNGSEIKEYPYMLELGTQNIPAINSLKYSIKYLKEIGFDKIKLIESDLKSYFLKKLIQIPDIQILSTNNLSHPIISFIIKDLNAQDINLFLAAKNICIRSGNHCSLRTMETLKIKECLRISLSFYNTKQEIDIFVDTLYQIVKLMKAMNEK